MNLLIKSEARIKYYYTDKYIAYILVKHIRSNNKNEMSAISNDAGRSTATMSLNTAGINTVCNVIYIWVEL